MRALAASFLLAPLLLASATYGSSPTRVEILPSGTADPGPFSGWALSAPFPTRSEVFLEPGEVIDGQILRLEAAGESAEQYRVRVQFETALAVGAEGPHLGPRGLARVPFGLA